ncbi:Histone H2B type 2-F [Cricetulus griseus]|uniref:Histone H2B type 2-F n=1 Tax=Cricetulus griseus TaxID=10029 RepID=G3I442_CRIGR|nr:Histone H2B type 2-F [Cricetulus griseus]
MKAPTKVQKDSNKGKHSYKENYSVPGIMPGAFKHSTITSWEIQKTLPLLLPRKMAKYAMSEGTKAITKYTSSK